ncbi:uncharacterized protein LOC105736397 [Apis florea]|uniref:uncharacterized protein LOC105736397 n=1 Tax=Apis florea TaxID=7463 RepID=UPI0012FEB2FB|nr:uncharacterized protein LOC105736397 [Apis florea]
MLLSQDVQQPQDNNEPLWNQLPYPGIRYEANRSQRRKDTKDAGSKYTCNRFPIEDRVEHDERLSKRDGGRSVAERKEFQRLVLLSGGGFQRLHPDERVRLLRNQGYQSGNDSSQPTVNRVWPPRTAAVYVRGVWEGILVDGEPSKASEARMRQAAQASLQIVPERVLSEIRVEKSL